MPAKQRKTGNLFSYIHSLSSFKLFLIAFLLSIVLTGSFFYYLSYHPSLIVKPITGDFIIDLTLFGRFFMFSGIIPGFLILIIIFRLAATILDLTMRLLQFILEPIIKALFNKKNYKHSQEFFDNLIKKEPKVKKALKDMNLKKNEFNIFWIAPIVAMVLAILPMPFGYFILLKLVVSAGALYFAVNFFKKKDMFKVWMFGFIVILYNPLAPIPLGSKILWTIVNIPTIYYFYINRKAV